MRPPKLIVSLAALCAFAVCNGRAQITNTFTFSATITQQGLTNTVDSTNTLYPVPKTSSHGLTGPTGLLSEIGRALDVELNHQDTNLLSKAAKLVLISNNTGSPEFDVSDGANFYRLTNIMTIITDISTNRVRSGTQNGGPAGSGGTGLAFPQLKDLQVVGLNYDDTSIITDGSGLQFTIQGIASTTTKDTAPVSGTYTETFSAKVSNMTGSGFSGGEPFIVTTATLGASGTGTLTVPPPS